MGDEIMQLLADRRRFWTYADLEALPEQLFEGWRVEIIDGQLVMSTSPSIRHEHVCSQLIHVLMGTGGPNYLLLGKADVDLDPSYLIPDLTVLPASVFDTARNPIPARDVLLAVEVVSPNSASYDRFLKPGLYAGGGLPNFWRVELEPEVSLSAYRLEPGAHSYVEVGRWGAGEVAQLTEPFAVEIPIDALARPGGGQPPG